MSCWDRRHVCSVPPRAAHCPPAIFQPISVRAQRSTAPGGGALVCSSLPMCRRVSGRCGRVVAPEDGDAGRPEQRRPRPCDLAAWRGGPSGGKSRCVSWPGWRTCFCGGHFQRQRAEPQPGSPAGSKAAGTNNKIAELFFKIDEDGSGKLDKAEIKQLLKMMGDRMSVRSQPGWRACRRSQPHSSTQSETPGPDCRRRSWWRRWSGWTRTCPARSSCRPSQSGGSTSSRCRHTKAPCQSPLLFVELGPPCTAASALLGSRTPA